MNGNIKFSEKIIEIHGIYLVAHRTCSTVHSVIVVEYCVSCHEFESHLHRKSF